MNTLRKLNYVTSLFAKRTEEFSADAGKDSVNFGSDFTLKVAHTWQLKLFQTNHAKLNEAKCFSNSKNKQEKPKYASRKKIFVRS